MNVYTTEWMFIHMMLIVCHTCHAHQLHVAAQVVTAVGGSIIDVAKPNSTAARIPEKRPATQKPCARYARAPW